jgi:hypothetical protein
MTTLQVSGFPASFSPEQIRRLFEPFGAVHAIRSHGNGNADCYEIEMVEKEAAEAAQTLLEGIVFGDQPLHVVRAEYSAAA